MSWSWLHGMGTAEALAQGVQRAGADIPVNNPKCA